MKLTKKEQKENMFMTWGRLRTAIEWQNWERAKLLRDKFQKDIDKADIKENRWV